MRWLLLLALVLLLIGPGCADDTGAVDRGLADLGAVDLARADAEPVDAARPDGPSVDQAADAFTPLPGLGTLGGACGVLDDTEWNASSPFLFRNVIDFGAGATFDPQKLTPGGQTIWNDGNRGGSSLHSEVIAFEVLHRCELAKLIKSESKITYVDAAGKKTDILVEIDTHNIGVSVTRAFHYPPGSPYTEAEAKSLLEKKLADLPLSQKNAKPPDVWVRSVLHVMAYDAQHADVVQKVWSQIAASLKGDAILILTVTDGQDDFIY
jgi:hypothetical protein